MSTHPLRSILVHLDGTARSDARLRLARDLAALHQSTLTAMFAVAPRTIPLAPDAAAPHVRRDDAANPVHRARALSALERAVGVDAAASLWREADGEMPIPAFVRRAFTTDLLVLGQRDPADMDGFDVPADFVDAVVVDSGRPAWIVPCTGDTSADPRVVLVAWKPTREAANAVAAALPVLRRARQVHVMCAEDNGFDGHHAVAELRQYLGLHRIVPAGEHLGVASGHVGEGMLSLAAEVGAELLVMGCYGHSRGRELILGGATRTVLRTMSLPVLTAH